jgi:hypothetical protein
MIQRRQPRIERVDRFIIADADIRGDARFLPFLAIAGQLREFIVRVQASQLWMALLKELETTKWPDRFRQDLSEKLPNLRQAWQALP